MKNVNRTIYSVILFSLVFLSACKKDDSTVASSAPGIVQIVTTGIWRVTYFIESGEIKTNDFTGYTFSFNSNSQLVATLSGVNTTGTWGWDDSSSKFHISIGSSKPLSDLTDDWLVLEKTETVIRLKNDNQAKNELVTFTRN